MSRPPADTVWTGLLVLVLAGAMAAVGLVVANRPSEPGPAAPPPGSSPASVTPAPTVPAPDTGSPGGKQRPGPAPAPTATASSCATLEEEVPLRVLTLNVHGGQGPRGFDIATLGRYLAAADVDVALLQEVDQARPRSRYSDMPAALAAATGMEVAYGVNVRLGPRRGVSGVATLSRHPILAQQLTRLPSGPGLKGRGVLRTDLDVDGTTVSVFNTHLEHQVESVRLRQVSAIGPVLAATAHPVILGGDLNAVPASPTWRVARSWLRDAWSDAGAGPPATSPAASPRRRIDYLMYAGAVRAEAAEVMPGVVSDHRAVRAAFTVGTAGPEICIPMLDGAVGGSGPRGGGAGSRR
ncbi:endonuclease/exonuclease/phosphatase family protein [Nocardioides sp. GCM10027113]|uniref:endonuclease/exonuclease/phosphatase family protein n=1 Tax=unclassified Nocardioides TaxID=2615069 RepID=UPI0036112294